MPDRAWIVEVGKRAALQAETRPRDMRWWLGYWEKWMRRRS